MSEPKVQLVDPQGNMSVTGMSAVGVITASSFDGISNSTATGITGTPELNLGIVTATSFVGQGKGHAAGLVGTAELNLGVTTATSFVGDATGKAAGLTGTPNLTVGLVTATGFAGNVTGTVTGNVTGLAASVTPGSNLGVGVCTALEYYGDGSTLTGAGSSAYIAQNINATGAETIIDLSYGNVIYYTSSSNTTVGFASTSAAEQITFIRDAGNSYTITWPDRVKWNNGTTPPLFNQSDSYQIFRFTTVDTGLNYNAWEDSASATSSGLFVSGAGSYGKLGQNTSSNSSLSSPVQIPGTTWSLLRPTMRSCNASIAAKPAGTIWMWGYQGAGEMGQNGPPSRRYSSPIQVGTDTNWGSNAAFGEISVLAAKTNGTLWSWGTSNYGNLGLNQGPGNSRSSPTQIGTDTGWGYVRGTLTNGYQHIAAIKTSGGTTGTLWAWGRNFVGSLGLNESSAGYANSRSSPTQVGTDNTWYRIWNGSNTSTAAIKNDGSLWLWGDGRGFNSEVLYSSPTQLPGAYQRCFIMDNSFVATKTNNTLWAWGYNTYGQLGQNAGSPSGHRSSPVQIPGSWDKDSLELSGQAGWVAKKVGSDVLWGCGINNSGQFGLNNTTWYSSPVQVHSSSLTEYGEVGGNAFGRIIPDPYF